MAMTFRKHIPSVTALLLSWKEGWRLVLKKCLVRAKSTSRSIPIRQCWQQRHKNGPPEFKGHRERCTMIRWEATLKMSREPNGWMNSGAYIRMRVIAAITIPCPNLLNNPAATCGSQDATP